MASRALRDIDDEACEQVAQIKAAVEAVGERAEVGVRMFGPVERVERAMQRCLEIAEDGVDPLELRQVARLALAHDDGRVNATRRRHRREAAESVARHQRLGRQMGVSPGLDRLGREAADTVELDELRTPLVVERDGGHERRLVLGAAPGLAAGVLAAQVGVVQLHAASEPVLPFALRHGIADLVLQRPSGGVAHAEVALEGQRGQAGLGLAEQVDRQEPGAQRQLGVLEQATHRERGLVAAGLALKQLARAVTDDPVLGGITARTTKPAGPACSLDRLGALIFSAEPLDELRQRHATLKLDGVHCHALDCDSGNRQGYRPDSSPNELPEATY